MNGIGKHTQAIMKVKSIRFIYTTCNTFLKCITLSCQSILGNCPFSTKVSLHGCVYIGLAVTLCQINDFFLLFCYFSYCPSQLHALHPCSKYHHHYAQPHLRLILYCSPRGQRSIRGDISSINGRTPPKEDPTLLHSLQWCLVMHFRTPPTMPHTDNVS